jgi:hypothetical protein
MRSRSRPDERCRFLARTLSSDRACRRPLCAEVQLFFAAKHPTFIDLLQRLDLVAIGVVLMLALAKIADVYLIAGSTAPSRDITFVA